MKILCTGSKGFIGKHLVLALSKEHTVLSFDLKDKHDIRNRQQVDQAVEVADIVYHLAALTDVQQSFIKPHEYYVTNVVGTVNVVDACKRYNKRLIYTSTAAVYKPKSSPYADSKWMAEKHIDNFYPASVILRLFNVYGEGMNKNTMLARFHNENPMTVYGDGTQTRDFIHIDDVINIMVASLNPTWDGFLADVGTGESQSVLSLAERYRKPIQFQGKRKEVYQSQANIEHLKTLYKKRFKSLKSFIDKHKKV